MNSEKYEADIKYRLAEIIAFSLATEGLITPEEYELLRDALIDEYKPIIGELERGMACKIRKSLK